MRYAAAVAVTIVLDVACAVPGSAQEAQIRQQVQRPAPGAPARDTAPAAEGTGAIKGRVFGADSSTPLRRARVGIASSDNRMFNRYATTDPDGRFEFKKLPKGRYTLVAMKGGYVTLSYGQRRPFETGRPVELADGQALDQVNFTLPRGSVITGRVVDDLGDPIPGVSVNALRMQYWQGKRTPQSVQMTSTDDVGTYRLYGLPPGDYIVGTVFSPNRGMLGGESEDGFVYAPTYYPGTASTAEAARVSVKVGQQRGGVDFALISSRTASIIGTAHNSKGQPAIGATISLGQTVTGPNQSVMMSMGGSSAQVQPDGTFKTAGVAPGEYELSMHLTNPETGEDESATTKVSVNGVDVTGVSLYITPGARVTGTVVAEGGGELPTGITPLRVTTSTPDGSMSSGRRGTYSTGQVKRDGSFEVKGLDGAQLFGLSGLPPSWVLKQVLYDGRDIIDSGLEFRGTEEVTGVQLVVSAQVTTVTGSVTDERGTPVKEYSVVIFADDSARWTGRSRYLATARPDQTGAFKVGKLPPGHYLAIAVDYLETGDSEDPEFLGRVRDAATKFTLDEGESKALSLKLTKLDT